MKTTITLIALLCLAGCSDRFRYECQDPASWNSAQCQKPICEVTRTCPDLLVKSDQRVITPAAPKPIEIKKGECK